MTQAAKIAKKRNVTPAHLRQPSDWTTASVINGAMAAAQVALPWTVGSWRGNESTGEFISRAILERVRRLRDEKGFVMPPNVSLDFPVIKSK